MKANKLEINLFPSVHLSFWFYISFLSLSYATICTLLSFSLIMSNLAYYFHPSLPHLTHLAINPFLPGSTYLLQLLPHPFAIPFYQLSPLYCQTKMLSVHLIYTCRLKWQISLHIIKCSWLKQCTRKESREQSKWSGTNIHLLINECNRVQVVLLQRAFP